jgi:hypothetical protein
VVDYKTGKPKSRNEVLGLTASSDGNYARQLAFYTLLLSAYEGGQYATRIGVISFVEPDAKGTVREEEVITTDEKVEEVKENINHAIALLADGSFILDEAFLENNDYQALAKVWRSRFL